MLLLGCAAFHKGSGSYNLGRRSETPPTTHEKKSTGLFFALPAAVPCFRVLYRPALTWGGAHDAPAGSAFLVDVPTGLGNGIWRKRPYGLRLRIFPQPLGGALKNPNAAPTTPPCFGRWPRSSSLLFSSCTVRDSNGSWRQTQKNASDLSQRLLFGGRYRTRTCDLLHVKQMLYQLS